MLKRLCTLLLALSLLFVGCGSALAVDSADIQTSQTILKYSSSMEAGIASGQIRIPYSVSSRGVANSIGVSSIRIYTADGTHKATIAGNTSNGLLAKNTSKKSGTYTYSGVSGTSYYAVVTFSAIVNGTSDAKVVTTNTITAP